MLFSDISLLVVNAVNAKEACMRRVDISEVSFVGSGLMRPECVYATKSGMIYASHADPNGQGGVTCIYPDGRIEVAVDKVDVKCSHCNCKGHCASECITAPGLNSYRARTAGIGPIASVDPVSIG